MANRKKVTTRPSERKRLDNLHRKIKHLFEDKDERFDVEIEFLQDNPPEKSVFPIHMLAFAIMKDFLDTLDLTLIGMIFTTILSLLLALILFMWTSSRMSGGWWKRQMIGWIWVRYIAVLFIEFIPLVKIVPAATIFVIMVHNKETKLVQLLDQSLEMIHGVKIKFK